MTHYDLDLSEMLHAIQSGEHAGLLRTMVTFLYQSPTEAEASEQVGADRHQRSVIKGCP